MSISVSKPVARWSAQCRPINDGTAVSDAFTPANNSLLVLCINTDVVGTTNATTFNVSGGSLTWNERAKRDSADSEDKGVAAIFTAPVTTGASMTVTIGLQTHDGTDYLTVSGQVYVVTGQHSSPIGATAEGSHTANPSGNFTLFTATGAGRAFYAITDWSANTISSTDTADTNVYPGLIGVGSIYKASDHSSGTISGNVTYGGTPAANWCALEVLAEGGGTDYNIPTKQATYRQMRMG
jgi:hypothetical protein